MDWMRILIFGAFWIKGVVANQAGMQLYDHLMYKYNKLARPILDSSDLVTIKFAASLIRIIDVDLKNQIFTTNLWLDMEWTDTKLVWEPSKHGNLTKLHIPSSQLWTPDIVLYNNAAGDPEITIMNDALVYSNGRVVWRPPAIYKSFCPIDITWFPYDSQKCELKFGLWSHTGSYVDMRQSDFRNSDSQFAESLELGMDLTYFYQSAEWDLMKLTSTRHEKIYPGCCGPEKYVDITYEFWLRRRTLFFTVNLIIPCFLISFLTTFVFYLSDHKITFAISILVALSVFLVVLIDIVPSTSTDIPMVGRYLLLTMILVVLSIMISVVSVNFHFRRGSTHLMPPWIRKVFIELMPGFLRMKRYTIPSHLRTPSGEPSAHRAGFSRDLIGQRILQASLLQHACGPTAKYLYDVQMKRLKKSERESTIIEEEKSLIDDELEVKASDGGSEDGEHEHERRIQRKVSKKRSPRIPVASQEELERQLHTRLVRQIVTCVAYLTEHYRAIDEDEQESDEWAFVGLVIDRLFLILYVFFNLGTLFIVLRTPSLYENNQPLERVAEADKPFGAV